MSRTILSPNVSVDHDEIAERTAAFERRFNEWAEAFCDLDLLLMKLAAREDASLEHAAPSIFFVATIPESTKSSRRQRLEVRRRERWSALSR